MLRDHFDSRRLALVGAMMLVLSPRIFGNAFFNTIDIVLMSFFITASYTMLKFLWHRTLRWALLHAVACALAVNARLIGVYILLLTAAFIVVEIAQSTVLRTRKFALIVTAYFRDTYYRLVAVFMGRSNWQFYYGFHLTLSIYMGGRHEVF